jgi:hypothetical protein
MALVFVAYLILPIMANKKQKRKYYLTFKAKQQGFEFRKDGKSRALYLHVRPDATEPFKENRYVGLLMTECGVAFELENSLMV